METKVHPVDSPHATQVSDTHDSRASLKVLDTEAQALINRLLYENLSAQERFDLTRQYRIRFLPPLPKAPDWDGPAVNVVDTFIAAKWRQANLPEATAPPPLCDDATFVRRVYLDLIGLIPPAAAARKFVSDPSLTKRARLIDDLLARRDDYAAHWTPFWEEALCSATADLTGGIGSRGNHRKWIFESFKTNKPFDLFVAELIDPTLPGYRKPQVFEPNGKHVVAAYIKNEEHTETLQSAANVAQVFLGTGMKCASCHSHFLNKEWPQARFLAFAGMFAPHDLEMIRCEKRTGRIIEAKFPFELPNVPPDVPKESTNRWHRAAQFLIDPTNPRFAKTIVNRLWKRYLGLGLFEPADDFRLDQAPSHPELLEWLAQDFIRHGYDLQPTIRLILNSRTYQLGYNAAVEDHFDIQQPATPRYFRSPTLRRLTAEQLIDSVRAATSKSWSNQKRSYLDKTSTALTRALGRPAARNEVSTARPDDVAVVQSLELLNGSEFFKLIYAGDAVAEIAAGAKLEAIVDEMYWLALSRAPRTQELLAVTKYLEGSFREPADRSRRGDEAVKAIDNEVRLLTSSATPDEPPARAARRIAAVGDVLWALFTNPEGQYIH